MEGWILAPAMEYLNVRHPFKAIATLLFRVADSFQWSIDQVRKVLEETQDTLTQRKQHVYHTLYVDDKIFFGSESGLPVVQNCHLCEKAIASFAWNVQSPSIFVTVSTYHFPNLLGVFSKNCGNRHFTAQYGPCSRLTTRGLCRRKFKALELSKSQKKVGVRLWRHT